MIFSLLLSSLLTFVQLNCENLFDTRHDSLKNDLEFTPEGSYHWTRTRYWQKINHLSQEIIALGETSDDKKPLVWRQPDLVALCEVENDSTMIDLTRRSLLRRAGYEYIMTSSADERGIDVALLYQPTSFCPVRSWSLRIQPLEGHRPTRDILYVCGRVSDGDSIHVFVLHSPSRRGGEKTSRPYRLRVAERLLSAVDSIYNVCPTARIIVSGDFNDYSESPALVMLAQNDKLLEVSHDAQGMHGAKATYRWHGEWRSLDHVFCSVEQKKLLQDCRIGDLPFLLEPDATYGGVKPARTYLGPRYLGGYSDHLPLVVRFRMK